MSGVKHAAEEVAAAAEKVSASAEASEHTGVADKLKNMYENVKDKIVGHQQTNSEWAGEKAEEGWNAVKDKVKEGAKLVQQEL